MELDTEAQRIAISAVRSKVQEAGGRLLARKEALEKEGSEAAAQQVKVAMIRLDVLGKIDQHLLEVLQHQYEFLEQAGSILEPGDMSAMWDDIDARLTKSLLQGL